MDDLISKQDIEKITNIGRSQFKAFRRRGLIDGHIKKTAIVKNLKTIRSGKPKT